MWGEDTLKLLTFDIVDKNIVPRWKESCVGEPPAEIKDLEQKVAVVEDLIKRARAERTTPKVSMPKQEVVRLPTK